MRRRPAERRHAHTRYFNPRTPCGVRLMSASVGFCAVSISIHAPRAGCDNMGSMPLLQASRISIHAPRAGCDSVPPKAIISIETFQSTHPVRGATWDSCLHLRRGQISIHAPRAGCDPLPRPHPCVDLYFNPRTPCGVRRGSSVLCPLKPSPISIHAPRAGCDPVDVSCGDSVDVDFNPRTPCGVRLRDFGALPVYE